MNLSAALDNDFISTTDFTGLLTRKTPGFYPSCVKKFFSFIEYYGNLLKTQAEASKLYINFNDYNLNSILPTEFADYDTDNAKQASFAIKLHDSTVGRIIIDKPRKQVDPQTIRMVTEIIGLAAGAVMLEQKNLSNHNEAVLSLANTIRLKDPETFKHCFRVRNMAGFVAQRAGLGSERIKAAMDAGLLHDIGKVYISSDILLKKEKLTDEEFAEIKKHPLYSFETISAYRSLSLAALIAKHHHERYDGTGYPDGIKGENIPLETRIITIVDAFEAMTAKRVYRDNFGKDEALRELEKHSGSQFDPYLVKYFTNLVKDDNLQIFTI